MKHKFTIKDLQQHSFVFVLAGGPFNWGWHSKEDHYAGKKGIMLMFLSMAGYHLHNTNNEVKLKINQFIFHSLSK